MVKETAFSPAAEKAERAFAGDVKRSKTREIKVRKNQIVLKSLTHLLNLLKYMRKESLIMLIDSHAHLDDECFSGIVENVINDFEKDRLKFVVEASCSKQTILNALELSKKHEKIYAILGVHPENDFEFNDDIADLIEKNCSNNKVVGIGEIGLDYHIENPNKEKQKQVFLAQAKIANKAGLPVCVHLRDAYGDFLDIVKENVELFQNGVLLHCYSGSPEFAKEMMRLVPNCYFAFGGASTFKNASGVRESVKAIPLERILSETDSPYLTPEPFRGKEKNQPKYVDFVVQKLADVKEITKDKMEIIIEENFKKLFKKIK